MKILNTKFVLASLSAAFCMSSQTVIAKNDMQNPLLNQHREAVSFSWKVQDNYVPSPSNVLSSTEESVEYWKTVSGAELFEGMKIKTSAAGALVRINGDFVIRNTNSSKTTALYAVHVFDKHSTQRLSVTRNHADYTTGDILSLEGDFTKASLPLNIEAEFGGLYEAFIDAKANGIQRRVKTAFALSKPTAKLMPVYSGTLNRGLAVNLQIKDAGRYEIRGVLYGTNRSGQLEPLLNSSTAQWLEKGRSALRLNFDKNIIDASGLKAPFELKHLQLMDQSRMGNLAISKRSVSIFSDYQRPFIRLRDEDLEELRRHSPDRRDTFNPVTRNHQPRISTTQPALIPNSVNYAPKDELKRQTRERRLHRR